MRPTLGLTPALVTDRVPHKMVVDSLVTRPDHPSAIGLDVDFSPDSHGYADPESPRLFDGLSVDGGTVPIRIGVNRSLALGRGYWLGNPNYLPLASCVVVPNADPGQSSRDMPEWIDAPDPLLGSEPERCYSMGVALVKAIGKSPPRGARGMRRLTGKPRHPHLGNEFLVDYSQLDKMIGATVDALDPAQLARADVKGKIVLLGRTQNTSYMFTVPGKPEQSYPESVCTLALRFLCLKHAPSIA